MRASKKTAQCPAGAHAYLRLPFVSLCGGHVGTPKQCWQPARRLLQSTCGDCSPEFQGRRRAERPRRPSGPISSAAEGSTTRSISTADFLSRVDQLGQFLSRIEHTCFYSRG